MPTTPSAMLRQSMTATRNRRRILQSWAVLLGSDGIDDFAANHIQRRMRDEHLGSIADTDNLDGFNAFYLPMLGKAMREAYRLVPATEEDPKGVRPRLTLIALAQPGATERLFELAAHADRNTFMRMMSMLASGTTAEEVHRAISG